MRRSYLDDLIVSLHPRNDVIRSNWEKALRQRNALLKQVSGRLDETASTTLDVWDSKAADAGEELVALRVDVLERIRPHVQQAYEEIAGRGETVHLRYRSTWERPLLSALKQVRRDDLRRSVTTRSPSRRGGHRVGGAAGPYPLFTGGATMPCSGSATGLPPPCYR
ncbi:MAG: hypothetical protein M5U19_00910 [Microthrixaceae bacterium]|nr:hypothetical protein [Microthrixaceae bacterium]